LRDLLGWKRGDNYFDYLLALREGYEKYWKNNINSLEEKYIKTQKGNRIPNARLIDMAFWISRGKKYLIR